MKKQLTVWTIIGILFTAALGTLLHFVYQWSGENPIAALISPVNESVWEHLKLLFFPMLFFLLTETLFLSGTYPSLPAAHTAGLLLGLFFIPAAFYLYTGFLGRSILPLDILIFLAAVILSFLTGYFLTRKGLPSSRLSWLWAPLLLLLAALFFRFTFLPPDSFLFQPPPAG